MLISHHTSPLQIETVNANIQMGGGKMHITPERGAETGIYITLTNHSVTWVKQIGNNYLVLWMGKTDALSISTYLLEVARESQL